MGNCDLCLQYCRSVIFRSTSGGAGKGRGACLLYELIFLLALVPETRLPSGGGLPAVADIAVCFFDVGAGIFGNL